MNEILQHINAVFAHFPETPETARMKSEMLSNAEERFWELRGSGQNPWGAAQQVIAECGDVNELADALGFPRPPASTRPNSFNPIYWKERDNLPRVTYEDALKYVKDAASAAASLAVAFASLFVGGMAFTEVRQRLLAKGVERADFWGLIALVPFLCACAVLLTLTYVKRRPYRHIRRGEFRLDDEARLPLENDLRSIRRKKIDLIYGIVMLAEGAAILIGGVILLIKGKADQDTGMSMVTGLFVCITGAASLNSTGMRGNAYRRLLRRASGNA
ncbi:MAG: hypothetical protein LBN02_00145 [Oscillospiraceae bacterium]|jgi:hypothetical protein|nr:hypothetical protein [Oscillospiraceae bacterium]